VHQCYYAKENTDKQDRHTVTPQQNARASVYITGTEGKDKAVTPDIQ